MNAKQINPHVIILSIYVSFSISIGIYFRNGLMVFLGWNMILVGSGYLLTKFMIKTHMKIHRFLWICLIMLWILLFPNMMYILTDFIHFQNASFFSTYPNIYDQNSESWILFIQITSGAIYASYLGMVSFEYMAKLLHQKNKINIKYTMFTIFTLSSVGIYIGRFLRFNSWDIVRPFRLLSSVIRSINGFSVLFIMLFILLHYITYYIFIQLKKYDFKGELL